MIEDKFSVWRKWSDRDKIDKKPGVYSIAISETDLTNTKFKLIEEIKYFGMTNSKNGLKGRLKQFDNTLIKRKRGHGGADRFLFKYQNEKDLEQKLFVSVYIFECDVKSNLPKDLLVMGKVAKFEFVCFSEYAKKFKKMPEFNDKKTHKFSLTSKKGFNSSTS